MIAIRNAVFLVALALISHPVLAQYGLPETLKAELANTEGVTFSHEARSLTDNSSLANGLFVPPNHEGKKLPALIVFHTCAGIKEHIRYWSKEAIKEGFVVLVPDSMRGLRTDCGSPPNVPNGRWVKDALDAAAHLATLPYVDQKRISIVGFSKGAFVSTWIASSGVAKALRPDAPSIASAVAFYGFCGIGPTRARPKGAVILQSDTDRPLLMLFGGKDNETPPTSCLEALPGLKANGAPVEWHLYPEATHCWDCAESHGFTKAAWNGETISYRYDAGITADSRRRLFEFLSRPRQSP